MDELTPSAEDSRRAATARLNFLTLEPVRPQDVRPPILASWVRSRRHWNLPADRITLPFIEDPDLDIPLTRSALPVLQQLHENLDGQPISVILTDRTGLVLQRLTADRELSRHLDKVYLVPGFSYAEEFAGTNGIGTALEGGGPMHVFGHEHYAEDLEDLACAGVPIRHPITGKTVGAIDLTCWRKDAGSLLMALAKTTAENIRSALLKDSSPRELTLLQAYLQSSRRLGDMVLAVDEDLLLMNANGPAVPRHRGSARGARARRGDAGSWRLRRGRHGVAHRQSGPDHLPPGGGRWSRWCGDHPGQPAQLRTGSRDAGRRPPPAAASGPARAGRPQCAVAREQS